MLEFSRFLKLNKIHMVDSSFNEDSKNIIFSREALFSGEGRSGNLGQMGNDSDIYCYANRGVVNFEREISPKSLIPKSL